MVFDVVTVAVEVADKGLRALVRAVTAAAFIWSAAPS
jgi:hypothetical protein